MTLISIALLATLGLIVGFFAGLLGIGGGAIMVPTLTAYFLWQGINPDSVVHLALATSMSCIIFTALLSIRTHQKHQAILWPITVKMSPAVFIGSAFATLWVVQISSKTIALVFMLLMFLVALQMTFGFKPKATAPSKIKTIELVPAGFVIGFISAMIAIGGGSLTVPYLSWHQINIKKVIATAASIGLPIAVAGCLVFSIQGSQQTNLPAQTIGYIYWPATLIITMGSALTTSHGANLTHKLPTGLLKKVFAGLIVLLAIRMFYTFD
ncbi:Uncharacterized UPF0721 integral membrane protein [hydrothermal vent metagenome]|uniref:Uncharacterized UPF0721 integral membrane protein n=1 Tax=hydrothermal vent metagenome TaxID=652676 RepID=A0A3B0VXN1_9ZZZZ